MTFFRQVLDAVLSAFGLVAVSRMELQEGASTNAAPGVKEAAMPLPADPAERFARACAMLNYSEQNGRLVAEHVFCQLVYAQHDGFKLVLNKRGSPPQELVLNFYIPK